MLRDLIAVARRCVFGGTRSDNVYSVTLGQPVLLTPVLAIVEPTASAEVSVCADELVTFRTVASYLEATDLTVPASRLNWLVNGQDAGSGESVARGFPAGEHVVEVRAFGDPSVSDGMVVTATTCTDLPPTATILTPSGPITVADDGFDTEVGLRYANVTFEGEAVDPEDGDLSGAALVWTTNRTDYQSASLGTGESLTVRLHLVDFCGGEQHLVSLQAYDSGGNPSAPVQVRVTIQRRIC